MAPGASGSAGDLCRRCLPRSLSHFYFKETPKASAAQAAASRANGALSHGPTSEEGKATSCLNALRTGLTGPPGSAATRIQATQARLNEAVRLYINAVRANRQAEYDPAALGFEFTLEQIELRALDLQPDLFHDWAVEQH